MKILRRVMVILGILVVVLAALYVLGPREPADVTVTFDESAIGDDPGAYLAAAEARTPGIRPGLERGITYAFPASRAKTPLAIVYVHGFSASRNEIEPVSTNVAARLGANLVHTRLTGHGATSEAMGEASVNDWVNDVAEALAIAERLGERIVVIGTSTGATLAALAATEPGLRERIDAIVQVSPNYALRDWRAFVLDLPFAETLVGWIEGDERSFEPVNEAHAANWTSRYPSRAVVVMAALSRETRSRTFENITIPTLFLFDERDRVIDPEFARGIAGRWGAATGATVNIEPVTIADEDDPYRHVITGDSLSPSMNERVTGTIVDWLTTLGFGEANAS